MHRREFICSSCAFAVSSVALTGRAWSATDAPEICTELALQDFQLALDVAIDENPENDPATKGLARTEAISLYSKKWNKQRRVLRVGFLTEPSYLDRVIGSAKKWEEHMGISFRFGSSNPDIFVSFEEGGSWSYLGTDSLYFSKKSIPSMNFGWFKSSSTDQEIDRTTIHEFGHALSLVHEHSHPTGNVSWNKPAVYAYYKKRGWDKERVDRNIFKKYELQQVNGSAYDPKSIMHYPIPASLVLDASDSVGWNTALSDLDKSTIQEIYPKKHHSIPG